MGSGLKERIDQLLVDRGLANSRKSALSLVMSGLVIADGEKISKAGSMVEKTAEIRLTGKVIPYVGRGGIKLEAALGSFFIDPKGMAAMDVGSSTGGFTDCLLKMGARKVYAIDVGYGLLAWSLRTDPRVVILERKNIREMEREEIGEEIDIATVDLSFISLKKAIPKVFSFLRDGGIVLALIKPQFEVEKGEVGRGGIIREEEKRDGVVEDMISFVRGLGLIVAGVTASSILGRKGNKEYFMCLRKSGGEI
ncbi:MAG TPA: TlyA family RNA methyltransferase [Nitrospiria bacterium]|nr:TlyA family RNA methyltransferase [Nitrospiria bacterium]